MTTRLFLILVSVLVPVTDQKSNAEEGRRLQQGFNLCKGMREAHVELLTGPPVALCHSTSSLPHSLSTTLCWKPLL